MTSLQYIDKLKSESATLWANAFDMTTPDVDAAKLIREHARDRIQRMRALIDLIEKAMEVRADYPLRDAATAAMLEIEQFHHEAYPKCEGGCPGHAAMEALHDAGIPYQAAWNQRKNDTPAVEHININGVRIENPPNPISYQQVVDLAESGRSKQCLHSVTYHAGPARNREGTLSPKSDPVWLKTGMRFSAYVTDNA